MAVFTLPKEFTPGYSTSTKPTCDVEIDWSNPLTKGMKLAVFDGTEHTNPNWESVGLDDKPTPHGVGINADGSSNNRILIRDDLKQSANFTFHCAFYRNSNSANYARPFGRTANGGSSPYANYDIELAPSGTQSQANVNIFASSFIKSTLVSNVEFGYVSLTGVFDTDTFLVYHNGVFSNSTGSLTIDEHTNGNNDVYIGGYSPTGYQDTGSVVLFSGVWQRTLSAVEVASLNDNPYQILKPKLEALYFPGSVASGADHTLLANDIESDSEATSPAIAQKQILLANDVQSTSEVSLPTIGQVQALFANDIQSTSEVSSPACADIPSGVDHTLFADDIESATETSTTAITQEHALLANDTETTSEISNPAIGQVHALTSVSIESSSEVSTPTCAEFSGVYNLLANDIESVSIISVPMLNRPAESEFTGGWDYPQRPDPREERIKQGIIEPDKPKPIKVVRLKDIKTDFSDVKTLKQVNNEREQLEAYRQHKEQLKRIRQADKDALTRIYLALNTLKERQQQIEEQDIVFMMMMLAA